MLFNYKLGIMKKLNKLAINSEKLMKYEELIAIKGGYDGLCCGVSCTSASQCCTPCPCCVQLPNWPNLTVCVSPGNPC
jgi:hypothetical protein